MGLFSQSGGYSGMYTDRYGRKCEFRGWSLERCNSTTKREDEARERLMAESPYIPIKLLPPRTFAQKMGQS